MSTVVRPHLYINSKGFYVTRHSYSGSETYNFCAKKYYLQRVQGWQSREQRSSTRFGTAVEKAVTFWHQHKQDTAAAVAEFHRLWTPAAAEKLTYTKSDLDWNRLNLTGDEIVRLYAIRYPTFPYIVNNPMDFQVQTNFEVFPGSKLAGIEFTSYIDLIATLKNPKAPDYGGAGKTGEPIIIDMKTSGKDVPELTVMDPQLRAYAWVKGWANVGFLWFRKCGRTISKGDLVTLLEPCSNFQPGDDAVVLGRTLLDELVLTPEKKTLEVMNTTFIGESKAVQAKRYDYIMENGHVVPENYITKQRVQFKSAIITPESAEDIGRSIKRDIINIANANEKDFWPMQSGVRYPNEKCPSCDMRGICSNQPELRDNLLVRLQLDELDFGNESE